MRFVVRVNHGGDESTLGPFNLETARATVTQLACEPAIRERFSAYVVPVPDDTAEPHTSPVGRDG